MPFHCRNWLLILIFSIVLEKSTSTYYNPYGSAQRSQSGCNSLITSNSNVKFTASSSSEGPGTPVLNGNDVWCAGVVNADQYLKVDLGAVVWVDQVSVQGKASTAKSVTQYYVKTSTDNTNFAYILDGAGPKAFFGPLFDGNAVVTTNFSSPVQTRYILFNPREPLMAVNHLCMRVGIGICRNVPTPIDGQWTEWSNWSACSPQCLYPYGSGGAGVGIRTRSRTCTNPAPAFGGRPCSGHSSEDQYCQNNCAVQVDGNWGSWTAWSSCSKTCGSGTKSRTRKCDNPAPSGGGANCVGNPSETINCFARHCPIDGGWTQWSQWSGCSLTCGGGMRSRNRACTNPPPQHGGKPCPGNGFEQQVCNSQGCPVDGNWTNWSQWTACSVTCGDGIRSRSRSCTNPPPSNNGASCVGDGSEVGACNLGACPAVTTAPPPTTPVIVDGGFSQWTPWAVCSRSCGGGTSVRTRKCDSPPPSPGGKPCNGSTFETKDCNTQLCPVDGGWSSWSDWTVCDRNCGGGKQFRTRLCDSPSPAHGGKTCDGPNVENRTCNEQACPVDGMWSNWTYFPCSVTCGQGKQNRTRTCTNPPPSAGGADCVGNANETLDCNSGPCAIDGGWSQWTFFECKPLCGPGQRNRTRTCTNPPPSGGGADCPGLPLETLDCNNGPYPDIPLIDLVFALSATSAQSAQSYDLMKSTIKTFINKYGVNKIHYSIIVYGDSVIRVVNFNRTFNISANDLKAAIDRQPALIGGPVLKGALDEAVRVFNEIVGRPGAKKVLVVITDKNSGAPTDTLKNAVRPLEDNGVLVISVGIGDAVERSELNIISPNPMDVISARLNSNPSVLAERIMDRILRRKMPLVDIGFAINAVSIDSDFIFTLMKRIINTIIDRYGVKQVQFSVISYGSRVATRFTFDDPAQLIHEELIKAVNETNSTTGDPNLPSALDRAKFLFDNTARPNATKTFVVLTDDVAPANDSALRASAAKLRKRGVLILSVGFGARVNEIGNQMKKVVISQTDYIGVPDFTTERPVVIAETIMFKALQANIPEIDLTFALSATSVSSETTFNLMKSTVNRIVQQYGIERIRYSVIVFGPVSTTRFDFSRTFPDKDALIRTVSRLPKITGNADLAKALESAKRVFKLQQVRPHAKKVLVVIMDNKSTNSITELNKIVPVLVDKGVFVIGVGVGGSVESKELQIITEENRNIIQVGISKNPDELAKEIMAIILRTSGYAQWAEWSTCSRTCRSLGVAGTRRRTRICEIPELGCDGPREEMRECNTQNCEGCHERVSLNDTNYSASSVVQPARFARLDTSNPGASRVAWCADPQVVGGYLQIDLGETVEVYRVATKGQEEGNLHWVTSYFLSFSEDGTSFYNYTQRGQTRAFAGNTDSSSVVYNQFNATAPVRYVRFHPISFNQQPCMQASVFGCSAVLIPPTDAPQVGEQDAEQGVLIALWILAGILTFLLLLACLYYCCWHVCCGRGKKRKGLAAYKDTSTEDGYLIEEDNKAWRLPAAAMAPTVPRVKTPEDEVQEVSIEMTEDFKPSGVIQFGIETEETKGKHVTAEEVHSEIPQYSEEIGAVKSGAKMMTMSSTDTGYRSTERRKRTKSETAASIGDAGATSGDWSYRSEHRQSSAFANGGYMRSQELVSEPPEPSHIRSRAQELKRSQSADELSTSDYGMFEQRRASGQDVVRRGEMGRDGYMRMKQMSRESADVTDGGFQMGTVDVAIGGIGTPDTRRGSNQLYGMEEHEITFSGDNGGRNVYYLDNGGYRTEEWYTRGGRGSGQLGEEGFREIHVEHQPIYIETQPDSQGFRHSRII
ncbi:hypothetical protein ACROYT_G033195 [Oculina patagonica]